MNIIILSSLKYKNLKIHIELLHTNTMKYPLYAHPSVPNACVFFSGYDIFDRYGLNIMYPIIIKYPDGVRINCVVNSKTIHLYKTDKVVGEIDVYEFADVWGDFIINMRGQHIKTLQMYYKFVVDILL